MCSRKWTFSLLIGHMLDRQSHGNVFVCFSPLVMPFSVTLNQDLIKPRVGPGSDVHSGLRSKSSEKFKYLWWIKDWWFWWIKIRIWTYKSALIGMHYSRHFVISSRKYFSYGFYPFYKEKLSFYCYFIAKSIQFYQGPLGLGPVDPWYNQALRLINKNHSTSYSNLWQINLLIQNKSRYFDELFK